jgi:hypothetical protein
MAVYYGSIGMAYPSAAYQYEFKGFSPALGNVCPHLTLHGPVLNSDNIISFLISALIPRALRLNWFKAQKYLDRRNIPACGNPPFA